MIMFASMNADNRALEGTTINFGPGFLQTIHLEWDLVADGIFKVTDGGLVTGRLWVELLGAGC